MACLWVIGGGDAFSQAPSSLSLGYFRDLPALRWGCLCVPCQVCALIYGHTYMYHQEKTSDLITTLKRYKNPLKPLLGNTLFHILDDENSTHSTCSFPIYITFLKTSTNHGRVIPVRPKIWPAQKHIHYFSDDSDYQTVPDSPLSEVHQ